MDTDKEDEVNSDENGVTDFRTDGTSSASTSGQPTIPTLKTTTSSDATSCPETAVSSPLPSCSGLTSIRPVGGSVSTNTIHGMRHSSGDQVLEVAGALNQKAREHDYSFSMETVQRELTGAKEVHFNITRTDIHQPKAVTLGGKVCIGSSSPPERKTEPEGPPTELQKLKNKTELSYKKWTEGMVMTKTARTILNKINKGKALVTVTGCPGEGKTTAGYLILNHLHDRGREVFDVKTPDDYFTVRDTRQSVIMLNDIFGELSYDQASMKKWQNVLKDVLASTEHKPKYTDQSPGVKNKTRPALTVILICRLSVLKEASEDMGKYKQLVLGKDNVVNLTESDHEVSERMKIWKYHAECYNVAIDNRLVREVCNLKLSHGFPHCCRLFAEMYSKNRQLNMNYFFRKPLDFLNQSMESLMKDSITGPLLREMLKNDGSLDLESIEDPERQYQYGSQAQSLQDTYLKLNGRILEFHHPSVYDSAAFVCCQRFPSFVISHCSLSFLNERVRVRGLQKENMVHTHHTLLVDSSFDKLLLQRFQREFEERELAGVLSHSSFLDGGFVSRFMENIFPSHRLLLNIGDKHSNKSFLFLMTKSGSDKILRYIHQYVELTEEEQRDTILGVCEHSSVSSLDFLLQRYKDINLEVTDNENQTPLLISTQKRSQDVIRKLLMRKVNVNKSDKKGRTPLLNACSHGVDLKGSVVNMLLKKGADVTVKLKDSDDTPLHLACGNGYVDIVSLLLEKGSNFNMTNTAGETPLHSASHNGHVDVVSLLLEMGADINTTDSHGYTPLLYASFYGHVEVVLLLLEKGADINTTNSDGFAPLHGTCCKGHVDIVSHFLENGDNINKTNSDGKTPLHFACRDGNIDVVSLLLEKGADINKTNSKGNTPLRLACLNGHIDCVSLLSEKGADINTTNSAGDTALHDSCGNEHADVVSLLLEKGADINTRNIAGTTPLHLACYNGHVVVVSFLQEEGADIKTSNNAGNTPLHCACFNGHVEVMSLLIEKGADINTTNNDDITPLHFACLNGHVELVSLLVEKGANINTTNNDDSTPLHFACFNGHVKVVSFLQEEGADIETSNNVGNTPLHFACLNGHVKVVSFLQEEGADIKTSNKVGNTPLHFACLNGHVEVVSLLVEKGADINTTNNDDSTPLHFACLNGHVEVVSLLVEKGADINTTNNDDITSIHFACFNGHVKVVSFLKEEGADIKTSTKVGNTPLHVACLNGHVKVVSFLQEEGADIKTSNKFGNTPLHFACLNGHVEVVSLLVEKGADINTTNNDDSTPLHFACFNGHVDVASLLSERAADINIKNSAGMTPLCVALLHLHHDVIFLLLKKGDGI